MNQHLNYAQVSGLIEALVYTEVNRYPHQGIDTEDLAQEIRMECIKAIDKYDPNRIGPSPYKYLQTCIKNRLYNMQRGTFLPNNPPCVRCEFWDKIQKSCKINEDGCDAILKYRKNMATKAAIKHPSFIETDMVDCEGDANVDYILLNESIKQKLSGDLLSDYQLMISGFANEVSDKNKRLIRSVVKRIMEDG